MMPASAIINSPPSVKLGKRPREPDGARPPPPTDANSPTRLTADYSKPLPYPPPEPAVEAMRLRILEVRPVLR